MIYVIISVIWCLYYRTMKYNYIIDDYIKREGYYTVGIVIPPIEIFSMKPSRWYRAFMVGMHCVNTWIIYLLWGWIPALLFGIHPMSVWGTAWVTGNYYATATYFTLIAYFILHQFQNPWSSVVAATIFNAGINSTVCPVAFPLLGVFDPWLATLAIPLIWLFNSKRFKKGMEARTSLYETKTPFDWRRIFIMTKVVAKYTSDILFPIKTIMFSSFDGFNKDSKEEYERAHTSDMLFFSSLGLVLCVVLLGAIVNPFATAWWFVCIGLHSQWNLTGQYYAQRYLYLASIGLYVVLGQWYLHIYQVFPQVSWIGVAYVTYLIMKTHAFIPAFKNMEKFLRNDLVQNPRFFWAYNNLVSHLMNSVGDIDEVISLLHMSEKVRPGAWENQMNLSKCYIIIGQFDLALQHTNKGLTLSNNKWATNLLSKRKVELEKIISGEVKL